MLESNDNPPVKEYQERIYEEGIPATMFGISDVHEAYNQLMEKGVNFNMEPTRMGEVTMAVFADKCGNLIQIAQKYFMTK